MSSPKRLFGRLRPARGRATEAATPPRTAPPGTSTATDVTPVGRVDAFVAAVPTRPRIALRLRTADYAAVSVELMHWFDASEYASTTPEYRAYRHAELACAGCGWEFPSSYKGSLLGVFEGARVVGAAPGFAEFGRTGVCPRCGSAESQLRYERIDPAEIDAEDVAALRRLWRDDAVGWWSRSERREGICDHCNRDMRRGEGYFISRTRVVCESCVDAHLDGALQKLRADPYRYGDTELRRARPFRFAGAVSPLLVRGTYGVERALVLWEGSQPDTVELKDLVESAEPG